MRRFLLFLLAGLLALTGCGPRSLEDFREEGEGTTRSLLNELQSIRTRDDLIAIAPRLEYLFERLVTLMIAAEDYREKNNRIDYLEFTQENHALSDELRIELNRIYRLEGGRELMEKSQEQALHRLDAFKRRPFKQKNN